MDKKCMKVAGCAVLAILIMASLSFWSSQNTLTGAVTGQSSPYKMCLYKYGRDAEGNWDWEKIQDCRNMYKEMEKGSDKAIPRLYVSSDRSKYQNEE